MKGVNASQLNSGKRHTDDNGHIKEKLYGLKNVQTVSSPTTIDSFRKVTVIVDGVFIRIELEVHVP